MKTKLPATLLKTENEAQTACCADGHPRWSSSVWGLMVALAITSLNAGVAFTNPLGSAFKSTDNGGTLPAIDAYKDGVGVIVLDNLLTGVKIDNSGMNTLVYKYGETAKTNNTTIANEVLNGSGSTNVKDKELATNINNIVSGNIVATINVDGTTCNDNNPTTTGEKWLNNICQGGVEGLQFDNCEGGSKTWQEAKIYCESKGMRLPTLEEIVHNGGTTDPCPSGYTWTSSISNIDYHYLFDASNVYTNGWDIYSYFTRCVK